MVIHLDSIKPPNIDEPTEVPDDYTFPSFFVFLSLGLSVPSHERLLLVLIYDKHKNKGIVSHVEQRKNEIKVKDRC